ncbi:hypothetical protein MTR67_027638 [Solanum verrucosum]|uniref:Uncharacterized protein n=1 Tax=Solanum verrucosum TaxID=315347 RepID=A0AAF0U079_SOLVR|nr:uncharacterized protein LOC125838239 [Solanum verrucosum]XP_049411296.1 uncharacterized protein LOC125874444 [Solanum stenotomum]WMV34253.1 hypothetical protein MTR67_027638 [Solanum verrucosum]
MMSLETASRSVDPNSGPRISFSSEFLDEKNFISICPNSQPEKKREKELNAAEFEFLSSNFTTGNMTTADELIFEGKLLPYWQIHHAEKLNKISLKTEHAEEQVNEKQGNSKEEQSRPVNWFIDEDPSPRPPTCTVLWKELLRLKKQKQRPSSLSPSSSSSSSSSSANSEISPTDESKEKHVVDKIKKRLERSKSATIRVRPLINVPICRQGKNNAIPPIFPIKKGRVER